MKSFDFSFGFCIPGSTNTWDSVYSLPPLSEELSKCSTCSFVSCYHPPLYFRYTLLLVAKLAHTRFAVIVVPRAHVFNALTLLSITSTPSHYSKRHDRESVRDQVGFFLLRERQAHHAQQGLLQGMLCMYLVRMCCNNGRLVLCPVVQLQCTFPRRALRPSVLYCSCAIYVALTHQHVYMINCN